MFYRVETKWGLAKARNTEIWLFYAIYDELVEWRRILKREIIVWRCLMAMSCDKGINYIMHCL